MNLEKAGASALIAGMAGFIVVMAFHPTHVGAPVVGHLTMAAIVHAAAILIAPALAFGGYGLTRHLGAERPVATLGLAFWIFGMLAVVLAASMSGVVGPEIISAAHGPDAGRHGLGDANYQAMATLSRILNQAFAREHVAFTSIAILLWSAAWPRHGAAETALAALGCVVGLGVLVWQLSGTFVLDVHRLGVVVLAQTAWIVFASVLVLRGGKG